MFRLDYNPFRKHIQDLNTADLLVLRDVAEGWYIEYKSQLLSVKDVAKSLCSFANHFGGWLFFGIQEAIAGGRTAGAFPGLSGTDTNRCEEQIRNAARDCVNPMPFYELKILYGPESGLGLPDNRAIVAVAIPQGINPPYIHSSGRIYRRVADSSDPKAETDRAILDQLWKRGESARQRLADFVTQEPVLSKAEEDLAMLHLSITSDPYEERPGLARKIGFDRFNHLMRQDPIPFNNIFPMANGLVARQVASNNPYFISLTWRLYHNCSTLLTIPINYQRPEGMAIEMWLYGYAHANDFTTLLKDSGHDTARVLDINLLIIAVSCAIARHRSLCGEAGIRGPFYTKAHLQNIWRCMPFFDTPEFIAYIKEQGFPLIQEDSALAPPGTALESFVWINEADPPGVPPSTEESQQALLDSLGIQTQIFNALGIPKTIIGSSARDLIPAFERAREVQSNRQHRKVSGKLV